MFKVLRAGRNSFSNGVGTGLLLHFWQVLLIPVLTLAGFVYGLMAWSLTQFIYMGPAILIARRAGNNEIAKGLILVAAIGVLLNGMCDAFLFGFRWPMR